MAEAEQPTIDPARRRYRLRQILVSVVANASRFMEAGSRDFHLDGPGS
jgi:hypothetical protein